MSSPIFRVRGSRIETLPYPPKPKELNETTFAERGFREEDIEEWLEHEPRLLGEDLLVIQRQADPVDAGNLYPDLVAIDREGALVIVELKQDWSGYDIYWQASVYAAAYWKRTPDEIIDLYGEYLHGVRWWAEDRLKRHTGIDFYGKYQGDEREKAVKRLIEHTGSEGVEDLRKKLNHRQRLVLVAHCFYETAATAVLWLRNHGLEVSCLRPIPYLKHEATKVCYVTMTQFIPALDEEALLVALQKIPSESDNAMLDRYTQRINKFSRSVAANLSELLGQDLMPSEVMNWTVKADAFRYFRLWYSDKPWNRYGFTFAVQVRVAEGGGSAPFRVTALFQFHKDTARQAGVTESAIENLRGLTAEFAAKPGYGAWRSDGWHEANKSIDVALDSKGAARTVEMLAEVIGGMYPRIEEVLGRTVPVGPLGTPGPRPALRLLPDGKKPEDLTRTTFAFPDPSDPHDWLVNDPRMLGEDLLVIQRDHSDVQGLWFDILAVDRCGALVAVEVWLYDDDWKPRKPIDWRAPLYAAGCWKRKPGEIIDLYAEFLGGDRMAAVEKLKQHTGSKDEKDLKAKLNHRQRALLVARTFAKEVTTAALWLGKKHGVDVSCLQLTPYLDEERGECYVDRTDLLQERNPKDLLTGLRITQRELKEHDATLNGLESQGGQVSRFARSVADKVKDRLEPELVPTDVYPGTLKAGDFRYYGLWYSHSPWTSDGFSFFIFVRVAKDGQDMFRVTALFQFSERYARSAGVSKESIKRLRRLTATFAEKPGWNTRSGLSGFYEAGKTVHVALDEPGAELAAQTLAEVIQEMYPRIKRVLERAGPAGDRA